MSWLSSVASSLGCSEPGLRLILGQSLGYPLMLLHRTYTSSLSSNTQHLFFFLSGLAAALWVIGGDVVHSLYAVFGTYLILLCAGGTLTSVILCFSFNFGYLLVGYIYTESDGYDICWTMPHCVLCLKLIGLAFDFYDGERAARLGEAVLSKDQKKSYLSSAPSLLEMLSHSFFIGGYFVGPQFPLRRYRDFVRPDYTSSLPSSPVTYGLGRLGLSFCYMVFHVIGSLYLAADWPSTLSFQETSFLLRLLLLPLWVKIVLAKYIFAWLVAEGVCVISGLSFVEVGEDGEVDWSGCANIKVRKLETATSFGNVIEAFNINTNHWVAVYIYKRLKFLGNQVISQVVTLFFLAVWHGFHIGYYIAFFNEFLTIKIEREFLAIWRRSELVAVWRRRRIFSAVTTGLGWLWVAAFLPHCFISFSLLLWAPTLQAYSHTYFFMYACFLGWWLVVRAATKQLLGGKPTTEESRGEKENLHNSAKEEKKNDIVDYEKTVTKDD